jgi:glycosyltransferase involved in cell wall biosynthesis
LPDVLHHKTTVIYNPINIPKEAIGLGLRTEKKNLIVSVGRLESQKNHHLLLKAFAKFQDKYPDYLLVIYGVGSKFDMLQSLVKELHLEENVSFPGKTSNVPEAIAGAKMFVLSSLFEGMSNALLEAMAIGIPCISTRVSGSTELIENHVNGLLVDVYDVDGIAEAMAFIASHPEEANIYAEKALHVMDDLNVTKISKIWVDYLRQLS